MRYRKMGKTGLRLSELSLGSWVTYGGQVGDGPAKECMWAAHDAGVNFFDGAEAYAKGAAELAMGKVIKDAKWPRESLVLSTKIFWGGDGPNDKGLSHKHVIEGVHAALKRWQVEYFDLVFCHRPDPDTPIEETVRAMDVLVRQGKIFYWGTSEWSAEQIQQAITLAHEEHLTAPAMEQPQYNMLVRERFEIEYAPLWELGYGSTIWSPLASGVLSGKYNNGIPKGSRLDLKDYGWLKEKLVTAEAIAFVKKLEPIAKDLGATLAQFGLAWCLKNPNVSTVITGATRKEQVLENMKAAEISEKITPQILKTIDKLLAE